MPTSRQLCAGVALVSFTAAALAGWLSVGPPADIVHHIPLIPEKSPPAAASQPADQSPSTTITAAERSLALELDPSAERCTGERLAELCLTDLTDLPGEDAAIQYARRWAMQSPQEMYHWFQSRGSFEFPASVQRTKNGSFVSGRSFMSVLFTEWAKLDPAAAMKAALACNNQDYRSPAVKTIISELHKTDPQRAVALTAEHMEFFSPDELPFSAQSANYRATWDALTSLPAGKGRSTILARYFDDLWKYRREDCVRLWQEMPASLRDDLAAGSFSGAVAVQQGQLVPQYIPNLEGMDELRLRHAETTGDTAAAAHFVASRNGREWAQRDPAAAIAWAQDHLKGEQRVRSTASLFCAAAPANFDTTLRLWQALPDGVLRARAAGNLAAGAPADRKPEVEALIAAFSPADQRIADLSRRTAESNEILRAYRERNQPVAGPPPQK